MSFTSIQQNNQTRVPISNKKINEFLLIQKKIIIREIFKIILFIITGVEQKIDIHMMMKKLVI